MAISPPCATFPRATWATRRGPRPIRSLAEPRGLAKLTAKERDPTFSRIFLFRWLGLPLTQLHSSAVATAIGLLPPVQPWRRLSQTDPSSTTRATTRELAIAPSATTQHMVASKATDQWPTRMAQWLAHLALATCSAAASTAVPEGASDAYAHRRRAERGPGLQSE